MNEVDETWDPTGVFPHSHGQASIVVCSDGAVFSCMFSVGAGTWRELEAVPGKPAASKKGESYPHLITPCSTVAIPDMAIR